MCIKTNDWGALDRELPLPFDSCSYWLTVCAENLATHRALHLQSLLPGAFQLGASEAEPELEPLAVSRSRRHPSAAYSNLN